MLATAHAKQEIVDSLLALPVLQMEDEDRTHGVGIPSFQRDRLRAEIREAIKEWGIDE